MPSFIHAGCGRVTTLVSLLQVVRRRAVPREVGPPPGGPALVHTQIPVVFFTQSGVPGEATEVAASSQDLAAVCSQAIDHIGQCISTLPAPTSPPLMPPPLTPPHPFPPACPFPLLLSQTLRDPDPTCAAEYLHIYIPWWPCWYDSSLEITWKVLCMWCTSACLTSHVHTPVSLHTSLQYRDCKAQQVSMSLCTGDDSKLDSDEAEYAWLSLDSLKPFREGDSLTAEDETHVSDPTLTACIAAAERAVKAAADRAAAADDAEPEGEEEDGAESLSDSDGGEPS